MSAASGIGQSLGIPQHLRGILYKEWLAHRNIVVGFWAAWLVGIPALMVLNHPRWIFLFGLFYAVLAAIGFGGMDGAEGSEEFVLSLPATRKEIFLTRLALGGGNLLAILVLSLLCLRFNLPQRIWGIFVESGFTERFLPASAEWYGLAFCLPLSVFATCYILASLNRSRGLVQISWFLGLLIVGLVFGLTHLAELLIGRFVFGKQDSTGILFAVHNLTFPIIIVSAVSAGILVAGYYRYLRKEGISRPSPLQGGIPWWVWALILLGILFVFALLTFFGTYSGHELSTIMHSAQDVRRKLQ
jgi:hypothetical protein